VTSDTEPTADLPAEAYLAQVLREIDDEVRRRRASGDLPQSVERELDELFLRHAPVGGSQGRLGDVLRAVDTAAYIDPYVPLASDKSGGAAVKRAVRSATLWYMSWITGQVGKFAASVSRAFHVVEEQLTDVHRRLDAQRVPAVPVVDAPGLHHRGAWWVDTALRAAKGTGGRVLHAAAGDGWLLGRLVAEGVDAYGVDPRRGMSARADVEGLDIREEPVLEHVRAAGAGALGCVILNGVVEPMSNGEREELVELLAGCLNDGGVLVLHSLTLAAWNSPDAPPEVDIAAGRPYRPGTWAALLPFAGFEVAVHDGPTDDDYLVVATRRAAGVDG